MRPTIDFKDDLGAVLRYHCTKVGISIAGYVKGLVYDDLLNNENREYEKEQLIVYYCFLCLARCVDDYDFLGKMKLAVTSFLMVRDMNTLRMAEQNGEFTVDDQVVTARIYAKEVEHSEWNLEYMADEFLFGEAYTPENLCVALTRQ